MAPVSDLLGTETWIVQLSEQGAALAGSPSGVEPFFDSGSSELKVVRGLGLPGMVLVEGRQSQSAQIQAALASHPLVDTFRQDRLIGGDELPNDPRLQDHSLPGLNNNGSIGSDDADIDAPEAWDSFTTGNPGVVVGVIDSGADLDHPDLYLNVFIYQGEIPANLKSSLTDIDTDGLITFRDLNDPANASLVTERPGDGNSYVDAYDLLADPTWANLSDDDGNGFVDDLFGWDFIGSGDNDPTDLHGHGTHVAGTIAAVGDNGTGVVGVAWNTSIMPLRFLDADRAGQLSDAISAINYATMMRSEFGVEIPVTNNSWGYRGEEDPLLRTALEAHAEAGMLFVAAAGNGDALGFGIDNDDAPEFAFYPASDDLDNVVSVAATDNSDRLARFSNFGAATVDVAAPGVGILSTDIQGDGYFIRSGTSMAAPHVAGVAALVLAENPDATALEVKAALLDPLAVDRPVDLAGRVSTDGRLNAFGSLDSDTVAPRATVVDLPNINGSGVTQITFSVQFTDNRTVIGGTIDENEIRVVDTFDGTELTDIELIDGPFDNAASVTALYRLTVPGGFNDGDFEVFVNAGSVIDAKGNPIAETSIGTFNADTTDNLLRASVLADRNDPAAPLDSLSLREAIVLANADAQIANTIRLTSGTYELDIAGVDEDAAATGDLDITSHVIIKGAGADRTVIDANQIDRVLHVLGGGTLELRDLSVIDGNAAEGGGIKIEDAGSLVLLRSMVSGNVADNGGGINNAGSLNVYQSTIHTSLASQSGGGVFNDSLANAYFENSTISTNSGANGGGIYNAGVAVLRNVTIAHNNATFAGGGISDSGMASLAATIVSDNIATMGTDVFGDFESSGFNLVADSSSSTGWVTDDLLNVDPLLSDLRFNGFSPNSGINQQSVTLTHALKSGSPAIDAAGQFSRVFDQRGIESPQDGNDDGESISDIGATERFFGTVSGARFHDVNENGIQDQSEPALANRYVYLDLNNNRVFDAGDLSAVTDESGRYSITQVPPGSYWVSPIIPEGWYSTFAPFDESIRLVSEGFAFGLANDESSSTSISDDGRYIVFESRASNLVPNDTNSNEDVFLFDRLKQTIKRLSVAPGGTQGQFGSRPVISGDGRFVAFLGGDLLPGVSSAIHIYDIELDSLEALSFDHLLDPHFPEHGSEEVIIDSGHQISLSFDGRFVAFASGSHRYVADENGVLGGDFNQATDIFVVDRLERSIERVSVANDGSESNDHSHEPSISGDGRYVVFSTEADNIVAGDTNGLLDVFVFDRMTSTSSPVTFDGLQLVGGLADGPSAISGDGRYIVFSSTASLDPTTVTNSQDIFVRDVVSGTITNVSRSIDSQQGGDGYSRSPSISEDGQYVTFFSDANNLTFDQENDDRMDLFVYRFGILERITHVADGPAIYESSAIASNSLFGGPFEVAFTSATNLLAADTNDFTDIYIGDDFGVNGVISRPRLSAPTNGISEYSAINEDGRFIAFTSSADNLVVGDNNGFQDVFVLDRETDTIQLVSVRDGGQQSIEPSRYPSLSGSGRYVAFESGARNLVPGDTNNRTDVFVYDRDNETIERVSIENDGTERNLGGERPAISANGRFVAYQGLVSLGTTSRDDIFVFDRLTRVVERVSVSSDGTEANDDSETAAISADGRFVAFTSVADNLVPNDTNGRSDVFVHDRKLGTTERVSLASDGTEGNNGASYFPSISADGRFVAFYSASDNLVPNDTNGRLDVFVYDRKNRAIERVSVSTEGSEGNETSFSQSLSGDGRFVTFTSNADNLIPNDNNVAQDVFVHDRRLGTTTVLSESNGDLGNASSSRSSISGDGRHVVFESYSGNLIPGDTNGVSDIFVTPLNDLRIDQLALIDVLPGEDIVGNDVYEKPIDGVLRGAVFHDEDMNGVRDANEGSLSGWAVYLDDNGNGEIDQGERVVITNDFGEFQFEGVEPLLQYSVGVVGRDFWVQTTPQSVNNTYTAYLDAGQLITNLDFGFDYRGPDAQSLNDLTGNVFQDNNRNGVQDDGEPGLAGWTVFLDDDGSGTLNGTELSETTTGDGSYRFSGLPTGVDPGTGQPYRYILRAENQSSLAQTRPLNNSLPAVPYGGALDSTQGLAVGKFNDDAYDDIIVASGDGLAVMLNDQAGGFLPPQTVTPGVGAAGAYTVVTGHFDNGPTLDLAFTNRLTSNVTVMLGNGDGTFEFGANYFIGVWPHGLTTGDFNRDDRLDLAVGTESFSSTPGKVSILYGSTAGDGTFGTSQTIRNAGGTNVFHLEAVQLTDDNIDGVVDDQDAVDLVVANYARANLSAGDVTVLYNGAEGFTAASVLQAGDGPASVAAADFNGDGRVDLAVANFRSDGVSIYENIGNGSMLKLNTDLAAGTGPFAVEATDIDDDGDADILVANSTDGRLAVLRNVTGIDRVITFGPPETFGSGAFPQAVSSSIGVGDFDGNGVPDISISFNENASQVENRTGRVEVFLNSVAPGGYDITLDGVNAAPSLDFGFIDSNAPPMIDPVDDFTLIVGEEFSNEFSFADIGDPGDWTVRAWYGDGNPTTGTPDASWVISNKLFTLDHSYANAGSYDARIEVVDSEGAVGTLGFQVTVLEDTLRVTQFTPTASGFEARFSGAIDVEQLNLYSGIDTLDKTPDVVVVGPDGQPVNGSVLWDTNDEKLTFVKTGGALDSGLHTITLVSGADAFATPVGQPLDGDANIVPGGDYVTTFTATPAARVIGLPDFARGPGQPVELRDGGIPITLSEADGLLSVDFTFRWNASLLDVTGINLATGTSGWFLQSNIGAGEAVVTAWRNDPAPASGTLDLFTVMANVPQNAPYAASGLMRLRELQLNEGSISAVADASVHKVAFLGDASGNARYFGLDASDIARVVVGIDSGFDAYPLVDPVIVADATGNGSLSGLDTSRVSRETLFVATGVNSFDEATIPPLPNVLPDPPPPGVDPTLQVTDGLAVPAGESVTVPVSIPDSASGLRAVLQKVHYDANVFAVTTDNLRLGSLVSGLSGNAAWTLYPSVDSATATITLFAFSAEPLSDTTGELFEIDLAAAMSAPAGPSRLDIDEQESKLNGGELLLTAIDGDVNIIAPAAYVVDRKIFYNNSVWDGFDPGIDNADDAAIATDKSALLLGESASSANYISSAHGITGLMIDIAGLAGSVTAADFIFATGNGDSPSDWSPLTTEPSLAVRANAGDQGSDRLALVWPNGTVSGTWLEVRLLANDNTGLAADDVFYYGSAPGETGNSPTDALVNASDFMATRTNRSNFLNPAAIDNRYDHTRDGRVDAIDLLIVRDFATSLNDSLKLISVPDQSIKQSGFAQRMKLKSDSESYNSPTSRPLATGENETIDSEAIDLLLASMATNSENDDARSVSANLFKSFRLDELVPQQPRGD